MPMPQQSPIVTKSGPKKANMMQDLKETKKLDKICNLKKKSRAVLLEGSERK